MAIEQKTQTPRVIIQPNLDYPLQLPGSILKALDQADRVIGPLSQLDHAIRKNPLSDKIRERVVTRQGAAGALIVAATCLGVFATRQFLRQK